MTGGADRARRPACTVLVAVLLLSLAACSTEQSVLHPAGREAADIATLFWIMTGAGALIWVGVMGTAIFAVLSKRKPTSERFADRFILVAGAVIPVIVLAGLLLVGLRLLPDWRGDERADLRVHVTGEQFWWRFAYETAEGRRVETANELHLPVDAVAEFALVADDVIHSFWIPALGGKTDLIPGRTNLARLHPVRTGTYRGVCAEFCGLSHALMAFPVTVHAPDDYARWLAAQAAPADPQAGTGGTAAGLAVFRSAGCGACHIVRGLSEAGAVGPDLTHLASRRTIAAGTAPLEAGTLAAWITNPEAMKPGAKMPAFPHLAATELDSLVAFLMALR